MGEFGLSFGKYQFNLNKIDQKFLSMPSYVKCLSQLYS